MAVSIDKATLQVASISDIAVQASQAYVTLLSWLPSEAEQVSQAFVQAVLSRNAVTAEVSQFHVTSVLGGANARAQVSQMYVTMLATGATDDPQVRVWTFTLDGHDFYVIRLGNDETLLYDLFAEQWYVWGSSSSPIWSAYTGINWQGGSFNAQAYGSNIIVGSDANGALFFLDPEHSYDDDAVQGSAKEREFLREVTGQVATRSIDFIPCYGVQLIGSIGEQTENALTGVTLFTSDDQGHTYDEHDTLTVDNSDYDARVEWWSLGSFNAPGRLFKIQDYGALHRIDFLEMIEDENAGDG